MKIDNINSLVELYFKKYNEIKNKKDLSFLFRLSSKDKNYSLNWNEVTSKIRCLTTFLQDYISPGDRCILLSENRPQWLIADIAIMNSGGVTVPLFTTYSDADYEYIINDCKPKICIVSNEIQLKKIETTQYIPFGTFLSLGSIIVWIQGILLNVNLFAI